MEFLHELLIPKDRVAVLIGRKGEVKKKVESVTNARISVDSKEGIVSIGCEDGLGLYAAKEVVTAISRGFNPNIALLLLKPDYIFDQIRINTTKNSLERIKGRIIGTGGKSRKVIEELTGTHISVYGKTVGIIGYAEDVAVARNAITSLINGAMHATVYRFLEKKRKEARLSEWANQRQ